jgi:hypothetical protein
VKEIILVDDNNDDVTVGEDLKVLDKVIFQKHRLRFGARFAKLLRGHSNINK